jgi:hypothetical protein
MKTSPRVASSDWASKRRQVDPAVIVLKAIEFQTTKVPNDQPTWGIPGALSSGKLTVWY